MIIVLYCIVNNAMKIVHGMLTSQQLVMKCECDELHAGNRETLNNCKYNVTLCFFHILNNIC